MSTVLALAGVVIKELYRRKDFYVLLVMTVVITLLMASINFFHESGVVRVVKDVCLLLLLVSALVIAVTTTARQIPSEREQRTIFPLLAKPVSRAQVVLGKFAGCWLACGIALLVFYLFFIVVSGSREHYWPLWQFAKAIWMQWMMLGIVVALVLLGSVVFAAPSSTATIAFVVVVGILLLGKYLNGLGSQQPEPLRTIVSALYFLVPHLEWYDLRRLLVNDRALPGLLVIGQATLYAALYAATLLVATCLVFRRKNLNV
jgi:ABC-type transport system involved in multi-copper enzyme maturation permease subunit